MTRAERTARVAAILAEIHPDPKVPLDHRDSFTLLVAALLSAQTTDVMVNRVTPALFDRAGTPEAMAETDVSEIQRLIRTCGLAPGKARNLRALARILVDEHSGRVPDDLNALEALPGVGHKTASVVLAQAFDRPAFPVDTHVHRLAERWRLSDGRTVVKTERDLCRVFPEDDWSTVHLRMVWFGRLHCPARGHDMTSCPICSWAATKKLRRENALRAKRGRRA